MTEQTSKAVERQEDYSQVVVWEGTTVGEERIQDFIDWFKSEFDVRVQYLEEIQTLPSVKEGRAVEGTGGRNDVFFAVHKDDIPRAAMVKLQLGARWIEDALAATNNGVTLSGKPLLYPDHVLEYKTWDAESSQLSGDGSEQN